MATAPVPPDPGVRDSGTLAEMMALPEPVSGQRFDAFDVGQFGWDGSAWQILYPFDGPSITDITYVDGRIVSFASATVFNSLVYDSQGRLASVVNSYDTKTITYNADGSVASFT